MPSGSWCPARRSPAPWIAPSPTTGLSTRPLPAAFTGARRRSGSSTRRPRPRSADSPSHLGENAALGEVLKRLVDLFTVKKPLQQRGQSTGEEAFLARLHFRDRPPSGPEVGVQLVGQ